MFLFTENAVQYPSNHSARRDTCSSVNVNVCRARFCSAATSDTFSSAAFRVLSSAKRVMTIDQTRRRRVSRRDLFTRLDRKSMPDEVIWPRVRSRRKSIVFARASLVDKIFKPTQPTYDRTTSVPPRNHRSVAENRPSY